MAANHLTKSASSCSSITNYSLRPADDILQLKSQNYESNNGVISETISDQGSSGDASYCDQKQADFKSRSLIKGVFHSRHGKLEDVQGAGGYGEVLQEQLQEINIDSDLRCNHTRAMFADVSANDIDCSTHDGGHGASVKAYIGDRDCIEGSNASLCKRDSADEQHGVSRRDVWLAAGGGDRHSSSGEGICTAPTTADRHSRGITTAKYDSSCAAIKTGVGYADTAGSRKCRRAGNDAGLEDAAESMTAAGKMRRRKKFVGVRQRPSGRWVAEIKDTTQKIRMWLGTFDTAEAAARAYDEAACLLRGSNTRTNFIPLAPPSPSTSPLASRLAHMLRARQSQNIVPESSSPSSPPSPMATTEPSHGKPLGFSSSHNNPISSSAYPYNRKLMQSSNSSAKHYPNCANTKQYANPHTNFFYNSFHNPYRKSYGNRQHTHMSNQGYSLHLLHPHTEAHITPLWRSSKSESESSESDPSPPHTDFFPLHKRNCMHRHDHFQVLSRYKDRFASVHGCDKSADGMPGYLGKEISGDFSCTHLNPTNEDMEWGDHRQIFVRDKNVISAEEIDTLTHDEHSMRANHNNRGGGFMDALMGINDDIILDPSEQMASSYYSNHNVNPFDFNVEGSLGSSMMQVDEFPFINELSGKIEEAEGGFQYVNLHEEEGRSNHISSSSSSSNDSTHDNAKLGLQLSANPDGSVVCGINSDLEMKRFERRASASLYALNGVHEMAMKQTPCLNYNYPGTNFFPGNSASTSFNFLSTSPSYMLSSPWKPSSASSALSPCDDSLPLNASDVNQAVINTPSSMPSNSSLSNCLSDTIASNNNSTLPFSNMGSDTTNNMGTSNSSINNNSSDAQSQEAAMWNSWDLAPLCTLVA